MSNYYPGASAPPPQNNRPPQYSEVAPTSYGSVATDNYTQPPIYQQQQQYGIQQPQPGYQQPQPGYQPQPVGYNTYQATQTQIVVQTQPGVPKYRPPRPSSHIWLSVFTMLCCCFILGLIAIIVGMDVDSAYNSGDDARARQKSKQALGLSIAAIGFGVVVHLGWLAPIIYLIVIGQAAANQ